MKSFHNLILNNLFNILKKTGIYRQVIHYIELKDQEIGTPIIYRVIKHNLFVIVSK